MKTLLYALAGEGLGHASRTYAMYEKLKDKYDLHLFTFGDAYAFLKEAGIANLHEIDGVTWARANGKIDYAGTYHKYSQLKDNKDIFEQYRTQDTVCITDFEPTITRYAESNKLQLISVDNQHKFSRCYNKDLSIGLKFYATVVGWFTERFIKNPSYCIISTFYHSLAKKINGNTSSVNVFIRNEFDKNKVANDGTIVVYDKNNLFSETILPILAKMNKQVIVYNNKLTQGYGFTYHRIGQQFVEDLHKCDRVICTAGNQLLGEAIYLGKPLMVFPETGQYEQYINAFYIKKMKVGCAFKIREINEFAVNEFFNFTPVKHEAENGLDEAVAIIAREVK